MHCPDFPGCGCWEWGGGTFVCCHLEAIIHAHDGEVVLAEGFLKLSSTPTSLAGFHRRNWGVALPMKSLLHKPEDLSSDPRSL